MDESETLSEQVGALSVADECGDVEDRTIEILQQLENFFSTPEFTGSLQSFVQEHIEKFIFVDPGAEQPLRSFTIPNDVVLCLRLFNFVHQ
jgi:hypothetical protein